MDTYGYLSRFYRDWLFVEIKFPQFNFKARVDKKGGGLDLTGHKKPYNSSIRKMLKFNEKFWKRKLAPFATWRLRGKAYIRNT